MALSYACLIGILQVVFLRLAATVLTSTGQTLLLNEIPYYVPATPFATVPVLSSSKTLSPAGGLVPATVVRLSASNGKLSSLESIIDEFGTGDDVWNEGFLEGKLGDTQLNLCIVSITK